MENQQNGGKDGKEVDERGTTGIPEKDKGKKVLEEKEDSFGPWMIVQHNTRGKKSYKVGEGTSSGASGKHKMHQENRTANNSRFGVLQDNDTSAEDTTNHEENVPENQVIVLQKDFVHSTDVERTQQRSKEKMNKPNPNTHVQHGTDKEKNSLAQPRVNKTRTQTQPNPLNKPI
ncbi:hypothetical protein PIB30_012296 [Stylosanthes scabra]|uniref:Uncharacterized protein n=1 Tax=Stylosanthes scabra TaxID=79078 RepID=A0ABU6Y4E5_9FABA|nr:hypothetical protein [Stylosanthes scabra]